MRWFFSRATPSLSRLLLIESGPRSVAEKVIPRLRESFGENVPVDLLTCRASEPKGLVGDNPNSERVWRVGNYDSVDSRWDLLCHICYKRYPVVGVLCAKSPIMFWWKLVALLTFPSKFIIVNENADYFSLDYAHLPNLRCLLFHRTDLQPTLAVHAIVRILTVPFALGYLLGYAAWVHLRRLVHSVF